jgi:hypothetical protein
MGHTRNCGTLHPFVQLRHNIYYVISLGCAVSLFGLYQYCNMQMQDMAYLHVDSWNSYNSSDKCKHGDDCEPHDEYIVGLVLVIEVDMILFVEFCVNNCVY